MGAERGQSGNRSRRLQLVRSIDTPPAKKGRIWDWNWDLGVSWSGESARLEWTLCQAARRSPAAAGGQCWDFTHPKVGVRAHPCRDRYGCTECRHHRASPKQTGADQGRFCREAGDRSPPFIPNFFRRHGAAQQGRAAAARFYDFAELRADTTNRKADGPSGTCLKNREN